MPGRFRRLFKRNSQGGKKGNSVVSGLFNKYFKCCFTAEKSTDDGDVISPPKTNYHEVWIKIPSNIRVLLLRIMYGIATGPMLDTITNNPQDPEFDVLTRQYARDLLLLGDKCLEDAEIFNTEPDHMVSFNLFRNIHSVGKVGYETIDISLLSGFLSANDFRLPTQLTQARNNKVKTLHKNLVKPHMIHNVKPFRMIFSLKSWQYSMDLIFEGELGRSLLIILARIWMLIAGNVQASSSNLCVAIKWKEIPDGLSFFNAIWGLLYSMLFMNQQLGVTLAIKMAPEHQTALEITNVPLVGQQNTLEALQQPHQTTRRLNSAIEELLASPAEIATTVTDFRQELVFVDTDGYYGDELSLGAPISGEWQNILQLSNSYHDLGQSDDTLGQLLSLSPNELYGNYFLPDHLQKLDEILPNDLQLISTGDLYPVLLLGKQVQLGKGAYGEVFLNRLDHSDGQLVAVKSCIISNDKSKQYMEQFIVDLEARVLAFLSRQSNLFPCVYGICRKDSFEPRKRILIEYIGHPSRYKSVTLFKAITFKDPIMATTEGLKIALDIAEGVQVMQSNGLIHNDIASRNILLYHDSRRWAAKITDFGSVCHVAAPFDFFRLNDTPATKRRQYIAAHRENAPELHFPNSPPTFKSDIYSLGIVFCDMGSHLRIRPLYEISKLCTHVDPDRRPVIDKIVNTLTNKINAL